MKYFLTFSGGAKNYYDAGIRIMNQARNIKLFDSLIHITDNDLKNDPEFWPKHSQFIENNKIGYGYWIWKPYIIKKTMEKLKDNDILLYCDAGCEIDARDKSKIEHVFKKITTDLICGSEVHPKWGCERNWCKKDLYTYLKIDDDSALLKTHQRQSGACCYLKCDKTVKLINEWYEIACNYHMIDDTPSIIPNLPGFREHRRDQAIFSLLTKKYNIFSNYSIHEAICLFRTRCGTSKIKSVVSHTH